MSFEIRINGSPFTLWKSASVQRSIDSNAGAFRFTNSSSAPIANYPVKAGDFVEILVNNKRKIAGFIDEISGSQDDTSHNLDVSGRDNTADLIDSNVPDDSKVIEGPISLKGLAEKIIKSLGLSIAVTSSVTGLEDFTDSDLQSASSGETCMAFLVKFARKQQVYLIPDGNGNLLIFRPDKSNKAQTPLIHRQGERNNNVLTYSFKQSQQDRFRTYKCRSQDNIGFDTEAEYDQDGASRKGEATDTQMRKTRYCEFVAEETMKSKTCEQRAAEESNIRRALGIEYVVSVAGVAQGNGTLWDIGQYVTVQDEYAGIKGLFLIKSVEYAIDVNGGTRTQLTCVPPDAYQVVQVPSAEDKRSAKTGADYQNETPKEQGSIR